MNAGQIILNQLGGANRLAAMVGATNIGYGSNHLVFQFKGIRQINMVRIEISEKDLYDISYYKYNRRAFKAVKVDFQNDVFVEELKSSIEKTIGLALSL